METILPPTRVPLRPPLPGSLFSLALGGFLACACAGIGGGARSALEPPSHGAPIRLHQIKELDEIALLEDRRDPGDGRLGEFLKHQDPRVRARAALALGRLPYPDYGTEITDPLCRALEDPDSEVRRTAAFSLGQRADPSAVGVLLAYRHDPDPKMRARVIEAASKLPQPAMHAELLASLRGTELVVRIEAAVGTARWSNEEASAKQVDRALLDALRPYSISRRDKQLGRREVETDLAWRILYALSRRRSELGRGPFLEYLDSRFPLDRLFAARGLGRISANEQSAQALSRALEQEAERSFPDWRVACEAAAALGHLAHPAGLEALLDQTEHDASNVRAVVFEALGSFAGQSDELLSPLRRGLLDVSPAVFGAALGSLAKILSAADAAETIDKSLHDTDVLHRSAAARALSSVHDPRVIPWLETLSRDRNARVASTALEALGVQLESGQSPQARALLHAALGAGENGRRLAAVTGLAKAPDPSDVAPLVKCMVESKGDISNEIAFNVLDSLGRIGTEAAAKILERALQDDRPHVRRVAHRNLTERLGQPALLHPAPLETEPAPLAGQDFPRWTTNPLVEMNTSRGLMVFELFPAEAPVHVHNFLSLAKLGHYEGLSFHRVAPDFVIQGGDYRGDGNGGAPWRGMALRQETGPRKFLRGALAMPRNEDPDSGGSQFFVTHRPTPHLDGRYTIFGQLRAGGDVLDRVELGDRILSIRMLP